MAKPKYLMFKGKRVLATKRSDGNWYTLVGSQWIKVNPSTVSGYSSY